MFDSINKYLLENKVTLVAVSKTHPDEAILKLHQHQQKIFGENKVQELVGKYERLPKDIKWHFIGHLQSNKVKFIASFIDTIHSIDSLKILNEVNKQAIKNNRVIKCLVQVKIASEDEKYGITPSLLQSFFEDIQNQKFMGIQIIGLMGMSTFTDDTEQVRREFLLLQNLFNEIKQSFYSFAPSFKEISMGMSNDYQIAIECGSTMVRIGSLLFGQRNY